MAAAVAAGGSGGGGGGKDADSGSAKAAGGAARAGGSPDNSDGGLSRGGVLRNALASTFLPDGVTSDYYNYARWRCFQRLVSATVNVFGVQAMLLALGIKTRGALGTAAATSWVLKDALGKIGRILWAGRMGRVFDSDSKRWRFRSSLLFAAGNGLEIVTYVFPGSFLLIATAANCLKQISMLTSSATRNAIYRSFAAKNNNIAEISAKGEAQIAVVDLVGMTCGILLSRAIGTSRLSITLAFLVLSFVDLFAIYQEIRAVVFKDLNYERLSIVLEHFMASNPPLSASASASSSSPPSSSSSSAPSSASALPSSPAPAEPSGA